MSLICLVLRTYKITRYTSNPARVHVYIRYFILFYFLPATVHVYIHVQGTPATRRVCMYTYVIFIFIFFILPATRRVCMYTYMYKRIQMYTCCVHVHIHVENVQYMLCTCIHTCTNVHTCIHVMYMYTYMHKGSQIYT